MRYELFIAVRRCTISDKMLFESSLRVKFGWTVLSLAGMLVLIVYLFPSGLVVGIGVILLVALVAVGLASIIPVPRVDVSPKRTPRRIERMRVLRSFNGDTSMREVESPEPREELGTTASPDPVSSVALSRLEAVAKGER